MMYKQINQFTGENTDLTFKIPVHGTVYYLLHIILTDVFNFTEIPAAVEPHYSWGLVLHDMRLCDVDFNFHTQLYQVNVFANEWNNTAALGSLIPFAISLWKLHSNIFLPTSKCSQEVVLQSINWLTSAFGLESL